MRNRYSLLVFAILVFTGAVYAETPGQFEVEIPELPDSIEGFIEFRDAVAETPQGGAAVFALAMVLYTKDEQLGLDAFTVALDASVLVKDADGYRGYRPGSSFMSYVDSYLKRKPYLAASYIAGTSPKSGYELPEAPYLVRLTTNVYGMIAEDEIKVFIACTGADSPRPVILKRNNRGIWKVKNHNSVFVGIRPPVVVVDDDL